MGGFGDPKSYDVIAKAVRKLSTSGAVRHGAECFNFYFPQDLDKEYLITWNEFPTVPWKYVSESELRQFLVERIDDGFVFPLNPKWVLCDDGWYNVFQKLRSSDAPKSAIDAWYPP